MKQATQTESERETCLAYTCPGDANHIEAKRERGGRGPYGKATQYFVSCKVRMGIWGGGRTVEIWHNLEQRERTTHNPQPTTQAPIVINDPTLGPPPPLPYECDPKTNNIFTGTHGNKCLNASTTTVLINV